VHRDVFAENIVLADAQPRRFSFVFQVLRRVADDAAGVKNIARANAGLPVKCTCGPMRQFAPAITCPSITA